MVYSWCEFLFVAAELLTATNNSAATTLQLTSEPGVIADPAASTVQLSAVISKLAADVRSGNHDSKKQAIRLLGRMGPRSLPAVRALIQALDDKDDDIKNCAADAISLIGPEAFPALNEALSNENENVRLGVLKALEGIRPWRKSTITHIEKTLTDRSENIRKAAIHALNSSRDERVIPMLIQSLKSEREHALRESCAVGIGNFGEKAKDAAKPLFDAIRKDDGEACATYSWALAMLGEPGIEYLVRILRDKDLSRLHSTVAYSIYRIGPDGASAVPALIETLDSRDDRARYMAILALGEVGPGAKAGLAKLKHRIRLEDERTQIEIAEAIFKIKPSEPEPIQICLKGMLNRDDEEVLIRTYQVMEMMGSKSSKAVPELIKALRDEQAATRIMAANVLGAIGPMAKDAMPVLKLAAKDGNEKVRSAAKVALEKICREGKR
jgi:HEAT repeat protein